MVKLLHKIYEKEIKEAIDNGNYLFKLVPAKKTHSVPVYIPKKYEGKKIMILILDI